MFGMIQVEGAKPSEGQKARPGNPWTSQITAPSPAAGSAGATPPSQSGFRRLVAGKGQNLTLLSVEVHADTRSSHVPLPAEVCSAFCSQQHWALCAPWKH